MTVEVTETKTFNASSNTIMMVSVVRSKGLPVLETKDYTQAGKEFMDWAKNKIFCSAFMESMIASLRISGLITSDLPKTIKIGDTVYKKY